MPASGASSHSSPSAVWPFSTGKAASPTTATAAVITTTSPIAEKRLRGSVRPGFARLLGEVGDGLEPVYASMAERQREGEVVPGRRDAEVGPLRERVRREEQRETEDHEQQLRRQVEPCDHEASRVELGAARQPHGGDRAG